MKLNLKTGTIYLASAMIALTSVGCGQEKNATQEAISPEVETPNVNVIESNVVNDYKLSFEFNPSWSTCEDLDSYDLKCQNDLGYFNVILYSKEDLKDDILPVELLAYHVEDLMAKRENPEIIEENIELTTPYAHIIGGVYSAEHNITKINYLFYVLTFTDAPDMMALVIANAVPSDYENQKAQINDILNSAKIVKVEAPAAGTANPSTTEDSNTAVTTDNTTSTDVGDTQKSN